jgi:NhaP-type Na+/H+ or K+/H+ antiporter
MTKYLSLESHPPYETALLFFIAYLGYLVTVILNFSGIISILCTGILMGHYTWYNLSHEGRIVSKAAFEIMGELLDFFVFVYVGFGTFMYVGETVSYGFIGLMILVVLITRAIVTVLFPMCLKPVWKRFKLNTKELITIWIAGSIRGAIAFALIISVNTGSIPNKVLMKTTILGIVLFTTVAYGSILPLFKQIFPIIRNIHSGRLTLQSDLLPSFEALTSNDRSEIQEEPKKKFYDKWRNVDDLYLRGWLIKAANLGKSLKPKMAHTNTQTEDEVFASWSVQ